MRTLPPARELIASSPYCSLVHLVQRLTAAAAPELEAHGLDPVSFLVLGEVFADSGISAAELARTCDLSPQRLAGLVDRAESAGLLRRVGARGRGRRTEISLTTAGLERLANAWPVIERAGSAARLQLDATRAEQLHTLVREAVGQPPAAPAATATATATATADDDVVVLCDDTGAPVGTAPRATVHDHATPLHLAFSTYLYEEHGRVLLTRRSLAKRTWPGVWTNSACGHLRPGETPAAAALRRVPQELGLAPRELQVKLPSFRYRAVDASGVRENEICPVLTGVVSSADLDPDPAEVAEVAWVDWHELVQAATRTPWLLSPWCVSQVAELARPTPGPATSAEALGGGR